MTIVLKVNPRSPDPKILGLAADTLRRGGIIVYPTDTVYGVGSNALDPGAVLKVFRAKDRPLHQPVPVAVSGVEMAERLAVVTDDARKLMRDFWPGALTIVLMRKPAIPLEVTGGREAVGLRAPNHEVPLAIIRRSGLPLVTTSANKHGKPSPLTAEDAMEQLGEEVDLVLDAGKTEFQVGSTIIDVTRRPPVILRRGPISKKSIEAVIGPVEYDLSS